MSGPVGDAAPGRRLARWALTLGPLLVLGLTLAWWAGALEPLAQGLARAQRAMQGQLAGALRALKSGQGWAWAGLMAMAFAYGFLHAAGPGHGKLVIGGYGMARRIRLRALLGLTLAASLAQAAVAVGLVMGGALVLGWGRDRLEWAGERVLAPLGSALILGLGLWIALRGVWHLWHLARPGPAAAGGHGHGPAQDHDHDHAQDHDHAPDHGDGHDHGHAGHWHAHGPTAEDVARLRGPWDAALLIGSIAIRPCTGALFLMIVTLAMGAPWAGISGVFVMGLGTAAFTGLVAALSVWAREGALEGLERPGARLTLAGIEVLAGLGIALAAGLLLGQGV